MIRRLALLLSLAVLYGCATPVSEIGKPPTLSPVGSGIDDTTGSITQYPDAPAAPSGRFSLWNDRQSRLFTDPRALRPGDILTVDISIDDRAKFKNESERNRTTSRDLSLGLGADWQGETVAEGEGKANIGSNSAASGAGTTERSERLELSVAAVVTDVLPNGNLMIRGSQEVRLNAELRILTIGGIVRTADIGPNNTIPYERIAEARISYGGRGRLTEVQQPPYGTQILDQVLPF